MCTAMQVEEFGGVYGNTGRGVRWCVRQCRWRSSVVCTAMQVEEFGGVYDNAGRGVRWCARQCR